MMHTTKAAVRSFVYMVIISAVFGFWQTSLLAGVFMLLFLVFIEKLARVPISITGLQSKTVPESETTGPSEYENEFVVGSDADCDQSVTLDSDINYRPCLNRFRYYSRFEIDTGHCEYEYRIDGTKVFARLLQDFS
ncbi:MAG: hypothetical protein WBP79_09080, partial [Candidatus Acidiferrales bacterium]